MTLPELQQALTSVESSAVLVSPWVMENVLRQVSQISGISWSTPRRLSLVVDRQILFRHVDQEELLLPSDHILPDSVILIVWPRDEDWQRGESGDVLRRTWRRLFNACVHRAFLKAWEDGHLTEAMLRERIQALGITAFEEIRVVLDQERLLMPQADERDAYIEFAAVFFELHFFAPSLLPSYFPALENPNLARQILEQDVQPGVLLQQSRLPGASEAANPEDPRYSEATEYFRDLLSRSDRAKRKGNLVFAAIERQRATRVAPSDQAASTRAEAIGYLEDVLGRFQQALDLPAVEIDDWRRLVPVLLDKADQGLHPAEAGLLYDLQAVCLDHEREIYSLDIVDWVLSLGKRTMRRPLPSQRLVRITRTLRDAREHLTLARLSARDRADLDAILRNALRRSEDRVRQRFRPVLTSAFHDVGLGPLNPVDQTSFGKMVEEILDRIIDSGFITFSDLRDTISRNQLKLPDLTDPQDFIKGDPLHRLDRQLSTLLDGVYRAGDIYLRWLERITALNFGTALGRLLTRFATVPILGGGVTLLVLLFLLDIFGVITLPTNQKDAAGNVLPAVNDGRIFGVSPWVFYSLWGLFVAFIFSLMYLPDFRRQFFGQFRHAASRCLERTAAAGRWLRRHVSFKRLVSSWAFQLLYNYFLKPFLICAVLWLIFPAFFDLWTGIASFLVVNFLANSQAGLAAWESMLQAGYQLFELIRAGLIPFLVRFTMAVFKQMLHALEVLLFKVDEWLRFREGISRQTMVVRGVLSVLWYPISFLLRFNFVVLLEPCLNPIKLPLTILVAKFTMPLTAMYFKEMADRMAPTTGQLIANALAWYVWFFLADAFVFLFWEIKENWLLYRANRSEFLSPVIIGHHGETLPDLFLPGFHSGTLPKLFGRMRQAERKALSTGNWSAVRAYQANQADIAEALTLFVSREFCVLLEQAPGWQGKKLRVGKVVAATNRVQLNLEHDAYPHEHLTLEFAHRRGWVIAHMPRAGWANHLVGDERTALENALAVLYKLAGVDMVQEHIASLLANPCDSFQFTPDGVEITFGPEKRHVLLRNIDQSFEGPICLPSEPLSPQQLEHEQVLYSKMRIRREDCKRCWLEKDGQAPIDVLVPGWHFLPPRVEKAQQASLPA